MQRFSRVGSIAAACVLLRMVGGCSDTVAPADVVAEPDDVALVDAAVDVAIDATVGDSARDVDAAESFVPVEHPPWPQVIRASGPVTAHPSIVTVTWEGDPLAPELEHFDEWLVTSAYWAQLEEYGVSLGTHEATIHLATPAPTTLTERSVTTLLAPLFDAGSAPVPTIDRIYVVYPPAGTMVVESGGYVGCTDFQGFHTSASTAGRADLIFAIIPRCSLPGSPYSDLDYTTWGSSHEVAEAATDPFPRTRPAWSASDNMSQAPFGAEIGDLCLAFPIRVEGHLVTALYSNRAAAMDQRFCLPAATGPVFGAFSDGDSFRADASGAMHGSISVFSAAPISLTLRSVRVDTTTRVSLGSSRVSNGSVVPVTVTLGATSDSATVVFRLSSSDGYHTDHIWTVSR